MTTESKSKPPEPDESPKEPTPTPKNDTDSSSSLDREQDQVAFLAALDDTASATLCDDEAEETEESESPEEPKKPDPPLNPYTAPRGISAAQLVNYLLNMSEKPHTIQERPGFGEAAVEAAERLITEQKKGTYWRIGVISKFKFLHKMAAADHEESEKKLAKFADQMKDSTDKRIAKEVRFLALERKAIDAEKLEMKAIEPLLAELKAFFQKQRLNERHMRIASMTVRTINQLDSEDEKEKEKLGDLREKYLKEFGELFAKSSYRKLAAYGNTIAKKPSGPVQGSDLVGKPLELAGDTASGMAFDWKAYRGKVVIVDFWATWCGPCVREMPNVKAFYEKHKKQGFDIVGVSLDRQLDALTKYIEEQKIPWANLAGDDAIELAQKYGVRAIPTMMLVDRQGKVVAVANRIEQFRAEAEKLLAAKDEEKKPAAEKPAAEKPATEKPATEKPATEKPATEKPAEKPAE